jgi:hypothetical protein
MLTASTARAALHPHPRVPAGPLPTVHVDWKLTPAGWLEATFAVELPPAGIWHSDPTFSATDYARNWGLWEHDVVELFVQARPRAEVVRAPYYELQLSPLGQPFALRIEEPRRRYGPPPALAYTRESRCAAMHWYARLAVQVPGYQPGAPLFGNLTACLGPAHQRAYFALAPSTSLEPDFHRPHEFMQLV